MKVKISTIQAVLVYLLVFFSTTYISYNPIKYFLIVAVGLLVLPNVKVFFLKGHRAINATLALFCIVVLVVSFVKRNEYSDRNPFLAAVVFVAALIEFTLTVEVFCQRRKIPELIHVFSRMTFWAVMVNDFLALFTNIHLRYGGDVFLVGTKFSVVYMHFYLICFFLADRKIEFRSLTKRSLMDKMVLASLLILTMVMSIKLETATGIVGAIALLGLLWLSNVNICCMLNAKSFLIAFIASALFPVFVEVLLSNRIVAYVITELLGRDITLTNRTVIYAMLPRIMEGHWLWGFGYGTGFEVLMRHGIADAQNGVLEWVQQVGVLGTLPLAAWLSLAMKKPKGNRNIKSSSAKPLTALVYLFMLLATVEITYSLSFLAMVVLLYGAKTPEV